MTSKNRIKTIKEIEKTSSLSLVVEDPLAFNKSLLKDKDFSTLPENKQKILNLKFDNRRKSARKLSSLWGKNKREKNLKELEKASRTEYKKQIPMVPKKKGPPLESITELRKRGISEKDMKKYYETNMRTGNDQEIMLAAMDYLNQLEKAKGGAKKRTSQTRKKTRTRRRK